MIRSSNLQRAAFVACVLAAVPVLDGRADVSDTNLGLAIDQSAIVRIDGPIAAFLVSEDLQGADLNRDGDRVDTLAFVFDARTGDTTKLDLGAALGEPLVKGRMVVLEALENFERDLNGDGDMEDSIPNVFDTERGVLRSTGRANDGIDRTLLDGRRLAFSVSEFAQGGTDLNGDGDGFDQVLHVFDVQTQRLINTGLALADRAQIGNVAIDGSILAAQVSEFAQGGRDLNGDGDVEDEVTHLFDAAARRATNLRIASRSTQLFAQLQFLAVGAGAVLIAAQESSQSRDLNGDGDRADLVLQIADVGSGRVRNTGLSMALAFPQFDAAQDLAVFSVFEEAQGADLNGDGDRTDAILHAVDTATGRSRNTGILGIELRLLEEGRVALQTGEDGERDLNGDGDTADLVVHLADLRSGRVVNTRVAIESQNLSLFSMPATTVSGSLFSFLSAEGEQGRDLNGDGDLEDSVLQVADFARGTTRNSGLEAFLMARAALANGLPPSEGRYAVPVQEALQGAADLNRDGDADDVVLHVFDARTGAVRNVGLATPTIFGFFVFPLIAGGDGHVSFPVLESSTDLNGDGDLEDGVLHFVDLATGTVTNVRRAVGPFFAGLPSLAGPPAFSSTAPVPTAGIGDVYTFSVFEAGQASTDLNGDGDTDDFVVHATRLEDRDRDGRFDFADDCVSRRGCSGR